MKKVIYFMIVAALCFDAELAATSPETEGEAVRTTLLKMWDAIERGDLEKYASFLHPDLTSFGENNPYLLEGKEKELRSMSAYLKRAENVHTEMHQPLVRVEGNVAWIVYYWTDEGIVDGQRSTSRGKSTRIFLKTNGRWLCVHGHYTAIQ